MLGKLHAKLEKAFNREFELLELFKYPTIESQSKFFSGQKIEIAPEKTESQHEIEGDIAIIGLQAIDLLSTIERQLQRGRRLA